MSTCDLSIIIVSYNTRELILACLESVFRTTVNPGFEVIVVDNASTDGSAEAIAAEFPQVRLIRSEKNLGFAGANNLAAGQARGEWLLLLNPDTVVLDGAVQRAVQFAQAHPAAGIVGGRTFFADGSLNYSSCHGRPTVWSLFCKGVGLSSVFRGSRLFDPESLGRSWKRDTPRAVDAVTGCFLLIRRELWNRLVGFDEAFFMYGEETDLCLRAWKAGYECWICPEATLIHYGGASEKARTDKMVRLFTAKGLLFQRHWSRPAARFGVAMLDLAAFVRMAGFGLASLVKRRHKDASATWRDIWRRRGEWHEAALVPFPLPQSRESHAKTAGTEPGRYRTAEVANWKEH